MLGTRCVASQNKRATVGNKITAFGKVGRLETSWVWTHGSKFWEG